MFGTGTTVPVPDVDRTDHLLMLGANPLASNGSLMTAPDMRGRLRALRARGGKLVVVDPRRTRTARGGRRAPLHPPRHRRAAAVRARPRAVRGGPGRPGRAARPRCTDGSTRSASWPQPFTPEAVAPACGIAARTRSAAWPASSPPRPTRRRVRPDRHLHPGVRDAGQLAGRRAQRAHRQPRPRRAAPCSRSPRPGHSNAAGEPGRGRGARFGRCASRVRGLDEVFGELPAVVPGRGDRHPGRGPGPGADHARRQPGPLHPQQRPARRRAGRARLHGQRRRLRQRDHPPRRRDPAGALAAAPRPLRPGALPCSRSATSPTTRRRCCRPSPTCPTSG